ncbi:MAG: DUF3592 domain-containing protein [Bacteroides sp.]|nr:DUF3592 domain-containing protein [Bacteroides sp.]MCM1550685.1 DUF3592 domain-containing protein [Clostridium sp.]
MCGIVFGIFVILLGIISFWMSWREWNCNSVTQGTVTGCCKNPREYNTGSASLLDVLYHEPWKYHITYTYEVDGKCYNRASETAYTQKYIKKQRNKAVTVYFNSAHPEESSISELTPDMRTAIKMVIIGGVLILFGLLLTFLYE